MVTPFVKNDCVIKFYIEVQATKMATNHDSYVFKKISFNFCIYPTLKTATAHLLFLSLLVRKVLMPLFYVIN